MIIFTDMDKYKNIISKASLGAIEPGRVAVFRYETPGEYQTSLRHAYWVRKNCKRPDGYTYRIETHAADGLILARVVKPQRAVSDAGA